MKNDDTSGHALSGDAMEELKKALDNTPFTDFDKGRVIGRLEVYKDLEQNAAAAPEEAAQ